MQRHQLGGQGGVGLALVPGSDPPCPVVGGGGVGAVAGDVDVDLGGGPTVDELGDRVLDLKDPLAFYYVALAVLVLWRVRPFMDRNRTLKYYGFMFDGCVAARN